MNSQPNTRERIEEILENHVRWTRGAKTRAINSLDAIDQLEALINEEREKAVKDYLKEGMFLEGWRIRLSHREGNNVWENVKIQTNEMVIFS